MQNKEKEERNMSKVFAKPFYNSRPWKLVRKSYFDSKFGVCELCHERGKIVHHIIELTPFNINDNEIALGYDNLQLLCQDCHNKIHDNALVTVRGVRFDDKGNLVEAYAPPKLY